MSAPTAPASARWLDRARNVALWARDSGLGTFGVILLVLVTAAGWSGSTLGLADFAATRMGYTGGSRWLVPATFDGASVGLSLAAFRAAINGRGALFARAGIIAFAALSSWMNYEHISDPLGRRVAALLPLAGVVLMESLLAEARRAYERRLGRVERPRLHPLRFFFDFHGTMDIIEAYILAIPVPTSIAARAAVDTAPEIEPATTVETATVDDTEPATEAAPEPADPATPAATPVETVGVCATEPATDAPADDTKVAKMREIFDQAVAEGRVGELKGSALARAAEAHPSLGRRKLSKWREELTAKTATA